MRTCKKCGIQKDSTDFSPARGKCLRTECHTCNAAYQTARRRARGVPQKRKHALGASHIACIGCGVLKPLRDFSFTSRNERHGRCKKCLAVAQAARRAENPEKHRAQVRAYRARYPERKAATARKSMYELLNVDYQALVEAQKGCCAICERPAKLCVDHVHGSNPIIVRGLLCRVCNAYLGVIKESPRRLFKAIDYLRKFSS